MNENNILCINFLNENCQLSSEILIFKNHWIFKFKDLMIIVYLFEKISCVQSLEIFVYVHVMYFLADDQYQYICPNSLLVINIFIYL